MVASLQDSVRAYMPNCGLPDVFAMQQRGEVRKFEPLSRVLIEENKVDSSKCAPMHLASIVANLRRFLNKTFGREANVSHSDSGHFTVWPARVFSDFSPKGSLYCILNSVFSFMNQFNLESVDFNTDANFDLNLKLLHNINKSLELERHLPNFHAYFAPTISEKELEKLRLTAKRHDINVVSNPDFATHIFYPDPPQFRESQTDHQVLVRILDKAHFQNQLHYFVHWFYHPDSYNDWLPQKDVLGHVYYPKPPQPYRPWHLQTRWMRDLDMYNEWMNELDYEMPLSFDEFVGISPYINATSLRPCLVRIRLHQDMHLSRIQTTSALDSNTNQDGPVLTLPSFQLVDLASNSNKPDLSQHPGSSPSSALRFDNRMEKQAPSIGNYLGNDVQPVSIASKLHNCGDVEPDDDEPLVRPIAGLSEKGPQRHVENIEVEDGVFLPKFSSWFSLNEIHDIEKKSLPEFFSGSCPSKTPATYKEIRNFIVIKWRAFPNQYLSTSCVRRCIAADACTIFRLHSFLNHWRLINYMSQTDIHPSQYCIRPPPVLPAVLTHPKTAHDTNNPTCFVLDDGRVAKIEDHKIINTSTEILSPFGTKSNPPMGMEFKTAQAQNSSRTRIPRKPVEYHCDSCGTDCSDLRFHCATKADMDLCAACYQNGRYTTDLKHGDFIEMVSVTTFGLNDGLNGNAWTENESMLLLEALEMYGDDWRMVADHVGSKSLDQCVAHFLHLPVEDSFLNKSRAEWWPRHPKQNPSISSPIEVLQQAGVNEEALVTISPRTRNPKVHSGEPPVSAEDASTIVPFVATLVSSCSNNIIDQVVNDLGIDATKMDEPYERAVACLDSSRKDALLPNKAEDICDGKLYNELSKKILHPASVPSTEFGDSILSAVSTFSKKTSTLSAESQYLTCLENSDCDVLKEFRYEMDDVEESDFETGSIERSDAMTTSHNHEENRHAAIPDVALLCAGVVAAQHAMVEDVEIERLTKLSVEIKLERVKRKIEHLADTVDLCSNMERTFKRRREQTMWDRVWKERSQCPTSNVAGVGKESNGDGDVDCAVRPSGATVDPSLITRDGNGASSFSSRTVATPMTDLLRGPKLPASTLTKLKLREVKAKVGSAGGAHDQTEQGDSGNPIISSESQIDLTT